MLDIENQEYLDEVMEFAKQSDQIESLQRQLDYLNGYAIHEDGDPARTKCILYKDSAPYSFGFTMMMRKEPADEYKQWFQGGLIYHGNHDGFGDGTAPTFSVSLSKTQGWEIHT